MLFELRRKNPVIRFTEPVNQLRSYFSYTCKIKLFATSGVTSCWALKYQEATSNFDIQFLATAIN